MPRQKNNSLSIRVNPFFFLSLFSKRQVSCETLSCLFLPIDAASVRDLMGGLHCPEIILLLKFPEGLVRPSSGPASLGPGQATSIEILAAGCQTSEGHFSLQPDWTCLVERWHKQVCFRHGSYVSAAGGESISWLKSSVEGFGACLKLPKQQRPEKQSQVSPSASPLSAETLSRGSPSAK